MRLVIVTHNIIKGDGMGRANYEIVRHALKNDFKVTLLAHNVAPEVLEWGAEFMPLQPRRYGTNLAHGLQFAVRANRIITRERSRFDVIHACGHTLEVPHHVNTSQFVHGAWLRSPDFVARGRYDVNGMYQRAYTTLNARWEKVSYANAQRVVAVSRQIRGELMSIGVPAEKIEVILNGADPAEFYPQKMDRVALKLPPDVPLALFVGDIRTRRKNLDTVLRGIAKAPGVHLAVGGRVAGSPFPEMAQELGIADRVHFLDFRRDVADLMRAADCFVFPSRYEACALVLMEAITSGLPVITAETTGGSEAVPTEAGVLLKDANDSDALAAALKTVLSDPEKRRKMGVAAKASAEAYTWTNIAETYLNLYRQFKS